MPDKIFIWIAPFLVKRSIVGTFRKFMEENHFKKLHDTGHFDENFSVLAEDTKDPNFVCVTYTHVLKNGEAGWEAYQHDRPPIKDHFLLHCEEAMRNKKVVPQDQIQKWVDAKELAASST